MGFSPLADMSRRIPDVGRSSERLGKVQGVLVHHNAGVNAYGQATAAGREVSAHYWITNEGDLLPNIDETRRAWTSGHPAYPAGALADHRFITVEVSNSATGGNWPISAKAEDMLARLIGDVHSRYKLGKVKRGTQSGVAVHRDFVATECPGGYVMANLDRIIRTAEQHRTTGAAGGSTGGLTVSEADRIIKEVGKRIEDAERRIKNSSNIGWLKRRVGGSYKGESLTAKLNRALGGIEGLEDGKSVDVQELAELVADAVGPRLEEVDAKQLADAISNEIGKRLSEK